jgi:tetratricopeptide (TPR) repeat protein
MRMAGTQRAVEHATSPADAASIILVVVSNRDVRDSITRALERDGFRAMSLANAGEASAHLAPTAAPVSLIIVDGHRPAERLARAHPDVPRVVLARDDRPDVPRLVALVHRRLTRTAAVSVDRAVGALHEHESALPHAAFLDAAADEAAHIVDAFLVLRHVDAWLSGTYRPDDVAAERLAIRRRIRGAPVVGVDREAATSLPGRLCAVLNAIDAAASPHVGSIAQQMVGLGHALLNQSQFAVATDAYRVVLHGVLAQPVRPTAEAMEIAATAVLRIGYCRRRLSDLAGARAAYATAARLGAICGVAHIVLSARLGEAIVTSELDDLADADRQMAEIIADAASERLRPVRAQAWHARGTVALSRDRYIEAAEYFYESWTLQRDDPDAHDRLLLDLAVALQNAGQQQLARRAHESLTHAPVEPRLRWSARVNLLYIAAMDRDEHEFDVQCARLDRASLTPSLRGEYCYYRGLGLTTFGRCAESRAALDRAAAIAKAHDLRELSARVAVAQTAAVPPRIEPSKTPSAGGLRRVANALFALDVLVQSYSSSANPAGWLGEETVMVASRRQSAEAACS